MNERIKELIKQADCIVEGDGYGDGNIELLVDLVVKECMTTILKESKWYWDKEEWESSNAIQNVARRVKEHFGVKE